MEPERLYARITDEYFAKILNWAVRKTGSREDGEDLAQEVFLQVFIAASRQEAIEKTENFVWKIAHFTWCNHVRTLVRRGACELPDTLPDKTDFAHDYAENSALQAELARMRRKIANLSKLQREAMILHYLDGLSIRETAAKLNIAESAVLWHLFDARGKIRKELETMTNENSRVYRPGRLFLSASGDVPQDPDTGKVNDSLLRQNICLLCSKEGKTPDELAELTGIPKPYIEHDLEWLTERGFLDPEGRRFQTSFIIMDQRYFGYRREFYLKRKSFIKKIIDYLWENESKIRGIGFYGSDFPSDRLMWSIITLFLSYVSRNSALFLRLKNRNNCKIRTDGGRYYVMAIDRSGIGRSDSQTMDITGFYDKSGWEDFYGICSDSCEDDAPYGGAESYYWLGVYNFAARDYRPAIVTGGNKIQKLLHRVYCAVIEPGFDHNSLNADEKEKLAEAVESGLIIKNKNTYKPNFVIFTKPQLTQLQTNIFTPFLPMIEPDFIEMQKQFNKAHRSDFPKAGQDNIDHHTYIDLWMFGIFTLMFAAEEKKILLPDTPENGVPLTLVLVT